MVARRTAGPPLLDDPGRLPGSPAGTVPTQFGARTASAQNGEVL